MISSCLQEFLEKHPSKINFNEDKLQEHAYLTDLIFSPARSCSNEQQFSLLLEILSKIDESNPFVGGIITNLCYRYNENKKERSFLFPELYEIKKKYDLSVDLTKPINVRWLISSTNTLGTIALMRGDITQAKKIFEKGVKKYSLAAHTPLLYMNLCMVYFQYAMIKYDEGRLNHSISLFERCYYLSISAVNEIFTSRNEYILSMKTDCEKLIQIGAQSITAKEIMSKENKLTGTRVPKIKVKGNFKSVVVLSRFEDKTSDWHFNVEKNINGVC